MPPRRCCRSGRQLLRARPRRRRGRPGPCGGRRGAGRASRGGCRPEEPPSSATVTTAVSCGVSRRHAPSAAASPCPPPKATTRGCRRPLLAAQVAVAGGGGEPLGREPAGELLGDGDAAVLAAGAAHGEGQVPLALARGSRARAAAARRCSGRGTPRRRAGPGRSRARRRPGRCAARSSGTQCGLGRNRASTTRSASSGRPYLKPKLMTVAVSGGVRPSRAKAFSSVARSWWTLRSLVSTHRSASPAMPVSSVALGGDAVDEACRCPAAGARGGWTRSGGPAPRRGRAT